MRTATYERTKETHGNLACLPGRRALADWPAVACAAIPVRYRGCSQWI
ncbi:hypothetical protein C4K22_2727 [Pseudomonas chlororaphis subsp. aurantiaca]|nr:hypothetical protein C4K24_2617 [Pseudomonas chlororaphis subsp. aurantiaca]AZD35470.1 hypothetical protein C4K22_2727 [Pseudomonas chlororaphis subsp. aurantiaca]AZD41803.1 hypothetical protein C4K21_2729 [Pseudomonas chlororaphis subsp. aurantiaca]